MDRSGIVFVGSTAVQDTFNRFTYVVMKWVGWTDSQGSVFYINPSVCAEAMEKILGISYNLIRPKQTIGVHGAI